MWKTAKCLYKKDMPTKTSLVASFLLSFPIQITWCSQGNLFCFHSLFTSAHAERDIFRKLFPRVLLRGLYWENMYKLMSSIESLSANVVGCRLKKIAKLFASYVNKVPFRPIPETKANDTLRTRLSMLSATQTLRRWQQRIERKRVWIEGGGFPWFNFFSRRLPTWVQRQTKCSLNQQKGLNFAECHFPGICWSKGIRTIKVSVHVLEFNIPGFRSWITLKSGVHWEGKGSCN